MLAYETKLIDCGGGGQFIVDSNQSCDEYA